jgi:hypothetical protein
MCWWPRMSVLGGRIRCSACLLVLFQSFSSREGLPFFRLSVRPYAVWFVGEYHIAAHLSQEETSTYLNNTELPQE